MRFFIFLNSFGILVSIDENCYKPITLQMLSEQLDYIESDFYLNKMFVLLNIFIWIYDFIIYNQMNSSGLESIYLS